MKFTIKNTTGENVVTLMRRIGYFFLKEGHVKGEFGLIRPLQRGGYPRFHLFLKFNSESKELIFNLHLDQRRPVYKGARAHAGEYEGEVVEAEAKRIKQALR